MIKCGVPCLWHIVQYSWSTVLFGSTQSCGFLDTFRKPIVRPIQRGLGHYHEALNDLSSLSLPPFPGLNRYGVDFFLSAFVILMFFFLIPSILVQSKTVRSSKIWLAFDSLLRRIIIFGLEFKFNSVFVLVSSISSLACFLMIELFYFVASSVRGVHQIN